MLTIIVVWNILHTSILQNFNNSLEIIFLMVVL